MRVRLVLASEGGSGQPAHETAAAAVLSAHAIEPAGCIGAQQHRALPDGTGRWVATPNARDADKADKADEGHSRSAADHLSIRRRRDLGGEASA